MLKHIHVEDFGVGKKKLEIDGVDIAGAVRGVTIEVRYDRVPLALVQAFGSATFDGDAEVIKTVDGLRTFFELDLIKAVQELLSTSPGFNMEEGRLKQIRDMVDPSLNKLR